MMCRIKKNSLVEELSLDSQGQRTTRQKAAQFKRRKVYDII